MLISSYCLNNITDIHNYKHIRTGVNSFIILPLGLVVENKGETLALLCLGGPKNILLSTVYEVKKAFCLKVSGAFRNCLNSPKVVPGKISKPY